jgi:hypothetical protein
MAKAEPATDGPAAQLTLQFLTWLAERPRTYGEVMECWRSSCPRLSVWEDALEAGLIAFGNRGTLRTKPVEVTLRGMELLRAAKISTAAFRPLIHVARAKGSGDESPPHHNPSL